MEFERMCRACMRDAESPVHLFGVTVSGDECVDLLRLVAPVRAQRDDGLPQQLCEACAACLDAAITFRRQCERSDVLLHQYNERQSTSDIKREHDVDQELPPIAQFDRRMHDYEDLFYFKVEPETQLHERVKTDADADADVDADGDADANADVETTTNTELDKNKRFKAYRCNLCRKAYTNDKSLRRHMAVHKGEGYKCPNCPREFARRDHLKKHSRRIHGDSADVNVDAFVCRGNARSAEELEAAHRLQFDEFEGERSDEDDSKTVGEVTTSGGGAVATIKEERLGDADGETRLVLRVMYKCTVCNIHYDNQHSYAAHMTKHSRPPPDDHAGLSCHLCNKIFNKRKNLKQHLLTHNEEKANKCTLCQRAFTRPDQLILHMNIHTGKKRHQCMHCEKGFNMLSTLKDHLRTHSGEKPYLCSICGKGFSQNTNLKQHLMRHSATKPFECQICQSKFVSKGELDAHLRKHTGEHPFVCHICGAGFTTSSSLVKHKRIHSGERPYACDLCPQRFAALGTLKNHRRTHTGEKPFECVHCGRAFTQRSDMMSHVRTHTGEKPYVCSVCGSAFQQSSALKSHVRTHHPQLKKPQTIMLTQFNAVTLSAALNELGGSTDM